MVFKQIVKSKYSVDYYLYVFKVNKFGVLGNKFIIEQKLLISDWYLEIVSIIEFVSGSLQIG